MRNEVIFMDIFRYFYFFVYFNCILPYHISLFSGLEQLLIPSQFLKPEV